jgi:hypothetical protein
MISTTSTSSVTSTNVVPTFTKDMFKPDSKSGQSISWTGFTTPEGWSMDGTFGTRMNKKSSDLEFLFKMTALVPPPPKENVLKPGFIFQMWTSFYNWGRSLPLE